MVDVQPPRTIILNTSYFGYLINATCGDVIIFSVFVVRAIACSTYLCRDVENTAGQLAFHHRHLEMLP